MSLKRSDFSDEVWASIKGDSDASDEMILAQRNELRDKMHEAAGDNFTPEIRDFFAKLRLDHSLYSAFSLDPIGTLKKHNINPDDLPDAFFDMISGGGGTATLIVAGASAAAAMY